MYYSARDKIDAIIRWSKKCPTFDTDFVNNCKERINFRDLTPREINGLNNIINRFHIDLDKYSHTIIYYGGNDATPNKPREP